MAYVVSGELVDYGDVGPELLITPFPQDEQLSSYIAVNGMPVPKNMEPLMPKTMFWDHKDLPPPDVFDWSPYTIVSQKFKATLEDLGGLPLHFYELRVVSGSSLPKYYVTGSARAPADTVDQVKSHLKTKPHPVTKAPRTYLASAGSTTFFIADKLVGFDFWHIAPPLGRHQFISNRFFHAYRAMKLTGWKFDYCNEI